MLLIQLIWCEHQLTHQSSLMHPMSVMINPSVFRTFTRMQESRSVREL